jgi:hypothetical protein
MDVGCGLHDLFGEVGVASRMEPSIELPDDTGNRREEGVALLLLVE